MQGSPRGCGVVRGVAAGGALADAGLGAGAGFWEAAGDAAGAAVRATTDVAVALKDLEGWARMAPRLAVGDAGRAPLGPIMTLTDRLPAPPPPGGSLDADAA